MTAPDQLAAIRSRAKAYTEHGTPGLAAPADRRDLLAIVDRVEALHTFAHTDVEPWAIGYKFSGDHCDLDGQRWPCETIAAITGEEG